MTGHGMPASISSANLRCGSVSLEQMVIAFTKLNVAFADNQREIHQKATDIVCVYVAVGQKSSTVKRVINAIQTYGAPERCIFVVA